MSSAVTLTFCRRTRPDRQHQHVIPGSDQQQVSQPGAQHDSGLALGYAVGNLHPTVQTDARRDRAVHQARQQARLLFGRPVFGDHRRGDRRRHERSRRHRATELFDHHHEFGKPVARAAVFLLDVQA
jgi:hypothetical protein